MHGLIYSVTATASHRVTRSRSNSAFILSRNPLTNLWLGPANNSWPRINNDELIYRHEINGKNCAYRSTCLERVEHCFTERLPGFNKYIFSQRIRVLGLTLRSLELRWLYCDLTWCHKIVWSCWSNEISEIRTSTYTQGDKYKAACIKVQQQ
jgi:hypothetical protein